jgi:curli production assembly/transport component CsgE
MPSIRSKTRAVGVGWSERRHGLALLLALAGVWGSVGALAMDDTPLENGPPLETSGQMETLEGVVLDHTLTGPGRAFYQNFVSAWREMGDVSSVSLALHELPSARWGSIVWVEHKSGKVYQVSLYPGMPRAAEIAEQAAAQVFQRIGQIKVEQAIFKDPDLGSDEFQ